MQAKTSGRPCSIDAIINQPELENEPDTQPRNASAEARHNSSRVRVQSDELVMHARTPDKLPDPWLFDSEKLLRELDRCREMVLLIPATTPEQHFTINIAVDSIWNLTQHLRFLLHLHRDGQRAFALKHSDAQRGKRAPTAIAKPRRTGTNGQK